MPRHLSLLIRCATEQVKPAFEQKIKYLYFPAAKSIAHAGEQASRLLEADSVIACIRRQYETT